LFYKTMNRKSFKSLAAIACVLSVLGGVAITPSFTQSPASAQAPTPLQSPTQTVAPTTACAFDPSLGKPNPLGMRSFISITEAGGNTTFVYEQFPSPVSVTGGSGAPVTIAQRRTMIFYNTPVAAARQQMLSVPTYYTTLLGSAAPDGFAPVNAVLTCRTNTANNPNPNPTPTPSASVASLPDGNYRYWTGRPPTGGVVSDEELLRQGGILFLFNKKGNQIVGSYGQIDNVGICLSGQVSNNTFTGTAVERGDATVISAGESLIPWDAAGLLRVRRGSKTGDRIQYNDATLDLSSFSRINAGRRPPVSRCQ
jgi:hypothetical protein